MLLFVFWLIEHLLTDHDKQPWSWIAWLTLGRGTGLMAGLAAGVMAASALDALDRIHAASEFSKTGALQAAIIAADPALAIAAVYYLAVPGARQAIGLSDLKIAGLELTLNPATQSSTISPGFVGQTVLSPSPVTPGSGSFWSLQTAYDMARTDDSPGPNLLDLHYFQREAIYFDVIDGVAPFGPGNHNRLQGAWINTFMQQRRVVQAQEGWMKCLGLYRSVHPFNERVAQLVSPAIEALIVAQSALSDATAPPGTFDQMTAALTKADQQVAKDLDTGIPPWYATSSYAQFYKDCKHAEDAVYLKTADWQPTNPTVMGPFVAIFLAKSLAGLGYPQSGLEVLRQWLNYDGQLGNNLPLSFRDQALMEFADILFQANGFPATGAERDWFRHIVLTTATDLNLDLTREGYDCGTFQRDPKLHAGVADDKSLVTVRLRTETRDRIFTIFALVSANWLHAAVDTRSTWEDESIGPQEASMARALIASADRCASWEDDYRNNLLENRTRRQAIALFEGGRTLSRWAIDGQKSGLLTQADAATVREDARKALERSLPMLRNLVRNEAAQHALEDAPMEPYLHMAQEEIVELEELSGH